MKIVAKIVAKSLLKSLLASNDFQNGLARFQKKKFWPRLIFSPIFFPIIKYKNIIYFTVKSYLRNGWLNKSL